MRPSPPSAASATATAIWQDPYALLAGALATAAMAWLGSPGPSWLDSGELIAAARELGGIHPPGHPAWLSLAGMAEWLPLGPHAARLAWLSALAGGLSVALVVRIGRLRLGPLGSRPIAGLWALAAGLTLAASASLWIVGDRVEVYTLALLGNLWALYAALRAGDAVSDLPAGEAPGRGVIAPLVEVAVAVALGLLNHHYVTFFALPAVIVAAWPALRRIASQRPRALGACVGIGAVLGLGYLALVLRAHADTELRWGDPGHLHGLWDTVTARHFQRSVTESGAPIGANLLILFGAVGDGLGAPLVTLGAVGLAVGALRRDRGQLALWLALLGGLMTKGLMHIDTRNPDDHGYILLAVAAIALGVAELGGLLFRRVPNPGHRGSLAARLTLAGAPLVILLAGLQASSLLGRPDLDLSDLQAPDRIDAHLRATVSPGSLYLSNYYGLQFNEQAFRVAEGRRPDMVAAHLSFRLGDTDGGRAWQRWFATRYPAFADLAIAAGKLGRTPVGNILERIEHENIYAEQDPEGRLPAGIYDFGGLAHRLLPSAERALDYDLTRRRGRHERIWSALYSDLGDSATAVVQTRAVLLWQHALQVAHALRRGWMVLARSELQRALRLAPSDRLLTRLGERVATLESAWERRDAAAFKAVWQHFAAMSFDALTGESP